MKAVRWGSMRSGLAMVEPDGSGPPGPATTRAALARGQVDWPALTPKVSVVIVNWRTARLTSRAVQSVLDHEVRVPYEIIVVDNASGDGSVEFLEEHHPDIAILRSPANRGFAAGSNLGAASASGEFLLFLNSDAHL